MSTNQPASPGHASVVVDDELQLVQALQRLGATLISTRDPGVIAQSVTDEATAAVGAQFGAFFQNHTGADGESYMLYTLSGVGREAFEEFPMPRNTALFDPTFRGTAVVRSDDITADPRYGQTPPFRGMPPGHLPVRSYLAVPVLTATGEVLGGLFFGDGRPGRFTDRHERLVGGIASWAALAIDNARLHEMERTARREVEIAREAAESARDLGVRLQQLTGALSRALTEAEVARVVADEAVPAFGARLAWIRLREVDPVSGEDRLKTVALRGTSAAASAPSAHVTLDRQTITAEAVRTGQSQYITPSTPGEWRRRFPDTAASVELEGLRTVCALPLIFDGVARGALSLGFIEGREIPPEERSALEAFASQCAQAMERAHAFAAEREARDHLQQVNTELKRAIDDLEAVLNVVPIGIGIGYDAECRDIRVNPAFARQLGIDTSVNASKTGPTAEELPFRVLKDGAEVSPQDLPMQTAARERRTLEDLEFDIVHADGRVVRLLEYAAPLIDERNDVRGAVGAFIDITERTRLIDAERAARAEAERANRVKAEFLASMSHELRTPLNAIAGYVQILEMEVHGPLTAAQREDLARIQRSQEHLLGLINDVLNFARLEAGRVHFSYIRFPIGALLGDVHSFVAPQAAAAGHTLSIGDVDPALTAWADPDRVAQILANLLGNAIKYTPAGGEISVRAEAASTTDGSKLLRIAVQDTGDGIAPDRLEDIFEPFVQIGRQLNRPSEGVGLGLAISRDLARQMGGDITVESTPGHGSTFTLLLPRA